MVVGIGLDWLRGSGFEVRCEQDCIRNGIETRRRVYW